MSRFSAEGGYREPTTLAFDRSWEREEPAMVAKSLLAPSPEPGRRRRLICATTWATGLGGRQLDRPRSRSA